MNNFDQPEDDDLRLLASIEASISAAGNYVCPSDDLRPRTLALAREQSLDRRSARRICGLIVVMAMFVLMVVPMADRMGLLEGPRLGPSDYEINLQAMKLAADSDIGPNWALLEALSQWRNALANRFHDSQENVR